MADSWTEIDGVALDWTTRPFNPQLYKYYLKAIMLAWKEKCYLTGSSSLASTASGIQTRIDALEPENINYFIASTVNSNFLNTILTGGTYVDHRPGGGVADTYHPPWSTSSLVTALGDSYYIAKPNIIRMHRDDDPALPNAYSNTLEDWMVQQYKMLNLMRWLSVPGASSTMYMDRLWYCASCSGSSCSDARDSDWSAPIDSWRDEIGDAVSNEACSGGYIGGERHATQYSSIFCEAPGTFSTTTELELLYFVGDKIVTNIQIINYDSAAASIDGITGGNNVVSMSGVGLNGGQIDLSSMVDFGKIEDAPSWDPYPNGYPTPLLGTCGGYTWITSDECAALDPPLAWTQYTPDRHQGPSGWSAVWQLALSKPNYYQFKDW
jgi:hypothetical protein